MSASAYETDQLTGRDQILTDAADLANGMMREVITLSVEAVNRKTGCEDDPVSTQRLFAREVYKRGAAGTNVPERGGLRAFGFEAFSARLEVEADALRFSDRSDIFGGVYFGDSAILSTVGTASTIGLRGYRIGTDKIDHFVHFGYLQWKKSRYGEEPERGWKWGVQTERTFFGLYTSKAFSYADLAANDSGARFFASMFDEGGPVTLVDGCVVETDAPFDWGDHVTGAWDEVLNPSVYTRKVQRKIDAHIRADRKRYCAIWEQQLGGDVYTAHLETLFSTTPPYLSAGRVPERTDPYRLAELCNAPSAGH
ncbi:MAG: hypothetical protein EP330_05650 [Deltaproteobacteria bacterium]|nr:MAG: hypothetical protein EP330_05650 [Deltaproteobacteria bacterium]